MALVSFAHLYIRLIGEACREAKESLAALYIDVTIAFAGMLRRILFDHNEGDEKWLKQLRNAGFDDSEIGIIYTAVNSVAWMQEQNLSHTDFNLVHAFSQSFYKNTWFSQESLSGVIKTACGSMAGMPLADIVYTIAFSRVLKALYKALDDEGLSST